MRIINIYKPTLLAIGLACLGLLLFAARPASATTPTTINFQGKVVNNTTGNVGINVADSSYTVVFRLYNSASPTIGGTCATGGCLWEETDTVTTVNGVFQVELGNGSGCSFFTPAACNNSAAIDFTSNSLYLTMKFNGDAAGFMTPLIHFTGVPYAYNAGNSGLLGGIAASGFIQNTTTAQSANIAIQSSASGNIGELIKGAASQSADFFQVQDSSGNILDRLDAGGNFDSSGYLTNPSGGLGAYGNALNWGEGFDNTFAWLRTNVTAPTADTIVDPTGATTAEALADSASGGKIYETSAIAPSNTNYTFSVWLKAPSGTQTVDLRIDGSTGGTGTVKTVTATTTWQRFFVTQNVNGFTGFVQPTIFPGGTGGSATIHAWGAQLIQGTTMGAYTRTGNSTIQSVGRGLVVNGNVLVDPQSSTTAFMVQSGDQSPIFVVDTQNQLIALGQRGQYNGRIDFNNSAGNNTVTLLAQGVNPTSSVSLFLPTAGGTGVQCLQSTSGSTSTSTTLQFGSCSGGSSTLATTYTAGSGAGDQTILLTSGDGGAVNIQDASGGLGGNLFTVQKFSGTVTYLGVAANGINVQSNATGSAVNALAFDTSTTTPHLKIYDSGGTANYADIYYTGTTAVYGASAGTAVLGSGTGPVSITAGAGTGVTISGHANSTYTTDSGYLRLDAASGVQLGVPSSSAGALVFNNSAGSGTATLTLAANPSTSYTYQLPTGTVSSNQCLQSGTLSGANVPLTFASCGSGGTFASTYSTTSQANNTITYSNGGGGALIIQNASTPLTTVLSVDNNTSSFHYLQLNLASSIPHLQIFGASSSNYADISYDASTSTATFKASTGTTAVGSGSGPINITAGSAAAITITANAASTWSTSAGLLTLQGTGGASLLSTTTTAVTVDSTTTGNVVIGATNNTNAKNTAIGNNNAGSTVDIDGGTGTTGIEIGNTTTAHGIQIGSNATGANAVLLGGANASSTLTLEGGTAAGAIQIGNGTTAHGIQIGSNATGANVVVLGGANSGSTLTLEAGTAASALQIGNSSSAHGIQIGAGGAAAGNAQAIIIGSNTTTTASKITLQAGNGVTSGSFVGVNIGGSTADANQILFQLHTANNNFGSGVDVSGGCSTTLNQGAMYYSSVSNSIHSCIGGAWEDIVSTASLGLQLFGVVPDTGSNPGDLAGVTGLPNGPCKVSEGGTTSTVSWTACTAYSGGRKVIVTAGTTTTAAGTSATVIFQHLCLTGTNNQPALSGIGLETANLSTVSMTAVANPILCLADIKVTNGSAVITAIYNTATYTTTDKEFASAITTAPILGGIVTQGATTPGAVAMGTALQAGSVVGVIVASTGATSTSTINVVVAINGPAWVKAITETGNAVGNTIQTTATGGYAGAFSAPVVTNVYSVLGLARTAWTSTCAINTLNCNSAVLTNVTPR